MVTQVFHRDFGSIWIKWYISSFIFKLFPFLKKYSFSVTWLPKYLPNWGVPLRNLLVILFLFPRKCQGEQMAHAVWPEGQEIQALTNCIQKHIAQLMTLAEIVLPLAPSVMCEPVLLVQVSQMVSSFPVLWRLNWMFHCDVGKVT